MLEVCALLIAGLCVGWLIRGRQAWVRASERLVTGFVYLMLFLLGLGVGANPEMTRNISNLGLQAVGITVFALTGSIAAGLLCSRVLSHHHER
jgi:uncharacterized membrane protein YbjE (DUF340 family)